MACTTQDCPYIVLGVRFDVSEEELKSAYRRLIKQYHPDTNPSPDATERAKLINIAWEKVGRPEARKEHDASCEVMREHAARTAARAGTAARAAGGTHARARQDATSGDPARQQHRARQWSAGGVRTGQQPPRSSPRQRQSPLGQQSRPKQQPRPEADESPTGDGMGWDDPCFVVGHRYATHDGETFRVLHINGDWTYIRFKDGREVSKNAPLLWASWLEYRARRHPRAGGSMAGGPSGAGHRPHADNRSAKDTYGSGKATWTPSATDETVLAWYDTTFVLGHWYAHQGGVYEVVGIHGDLIDVRYPDGTEATFRRSVLRDAWVAIRRAWLSRKRVHT